MGTDWLMQDHLRAAQADALRFHGAGPVRAWRPARVQRGWWLVLPPVLAAMAAIGLAGGEAEVATPVAPAARPAPTVLRAERATPAPLPRSASTDPGLAPVVAPAAAEAADDAQEPRLHNIPVLAEAEGIDTEPEPEAEPVLGGGSE